MMTKGLLVVALFGCGSSSPSDDGPLGGTVAKTTWAFDGGIYFVDTSTTPSSLRVVLTTDLAPACFEAGGTVPTMAEIQAVLPSDQAGLSTFTAGTIVAIYPGQDGVRADMNATFDGLTLDATMLLSGALSASNGSGDDISGTFTAKKCN
jgi:hypothetical protein